jgi:hypothetical protein
MNSAGRRPTSVVAPSASSSASVSTCVVFGSASRPPAPPSFAARVDIARGRAPSAYASAAPPLAPAPALAGAATVTGAGRWRDGLYEPPPDPLAARKTAERERDLCISHSHPQQLFQQSANVDPAAAAAVARRRAWAIARREREWREREGARRSAAAVETQAIGEKLGVRAWAQEPVRAGLHHHQHRHQQLQLNQPQSSQLRPGTSQQRQQQSLRLQPRAASAALGVPSTGTTDTSQGSTADATVAVAATTAAAAVAERDATIALVRRLRFEEQQLRALAAAADARALHALTTAPAAASVAGTAAAAAAAGGVWLPTPERGIWAGEAPGRTFIMPTTSVDGLDYKRRHTVTATAATAASVASGSGPTGQAQETRAVLASTYLKSGAPPAPGLDYTTHPALLRRAH